MKTLAILALITATAFSQGPLTPPGAPAPTMKTLDEIHAKVADAGEKRTPISSLPFAIDQPGSYYLAGNLSTAAGNGISIDAQDVTIDLNGFRMTGTGNAAAILVTNMRTLVVQNGTFRDWGVAISGVGAVLDAVNIEGVHIIGGDGIQLGGARNARVSDCVFENCDVEYAYALDQGILVLGRNSVVSDCRISESNGVNPLHRYIYAILIGENSLVRDCVVGVNGNGGIRCGVGSIVRNCVVSGSSAQSLAIFATGVKECTVRGTFQFGVIGTRVSGCHIVLTGGSAEPGGNIGIKGEINSRISDCTVSGPPMFVGVHLQAGATVEGGAVTGFDTGISTVENCVVRNCKVQGAQSTNILAGNDCKIMDCQIANAPFGISAGARCVVSKNEVRGNTPGLAIGTGILVSSGGSVVIEANEIIACAIGISVSTTSNMVSRNTLRFNVLPLSIVGGNEVGPTGTPSTATSPFANLVY